MVCLGGEILDPFKSFYLSSEQTSYTTSVTRLGDFESFGKNISSKRSPNDWQLFGLFRENLHWLLFGQLLEKLGYFLLQHLVTLIMRCLPCFGISYTTAYHLGQYEYSSHSTKGLLGLTMSCFIVPLKITFYCFC